MTLFGLRSRKERSFGNDDKNGCWVALPRHLFSLAGARNELMSRSLRDVRSSPSPTSCASVTERSVRISEMRG